VRLQGLDGTASPEPVLVGPGRVRFLPRLFLIAIAFELARTVFTSLWQRLVYFPNVFPNSQSAIPSEALTLGDTLGSFAISPCLLFVAYYYLGKGVSLDNNLRAPIVSLFLGGAIGGVLSFFLGYIAFAGITLSEYLSYLTSAFSSPWTLGTFSVEAVGDGLFNIFVGVAALFIFSYVARKTMANREARADNEERGVNEPDSGP
jgi:hypothetical protein